MISNKAAQIIVEFDRSLLQHFDVRSWNEFLDKLHAANLTPTIWSPGERPPPVGVMLDFSRLQRAHYRLRGINLGACCWLADADFGGADLEGATLGCCPRANFRQSRLANASFVGSITAADFTGATGVETAHWEEASFEADMPPAGLPQEVIARCGLEANKPPRLPREPENPAEPTGCTVVPLRACVTINEVPW